jgi:hypothetical protein
MLLHMKRFYIYLLSDSRTGEVFYVGKGSGKRLQSHLSAMRRGSQLRVHKRIRLLQSEGGQVIFQKVFESNDEVATYREEQEWIAFYGRRNLTNGTDGGSSCFHGDRKGVVFSDAHRENLSKALTGRVVLEETRRKISASLLGHPVSAESREKAAAKLRGRKRGPVSDETRRRMCLAQAGKVNSPEARAKMRLAKLGKKLGPRPAEWSAKIQAAVARNHASPEFRKAQAARMRLWWAERKAVAA